MPFLKFFEVNTPVIQGKSEHPCSYLKKFAHKQAASPLNLSHNRIPEMPSIPEFFCKKYAILAFSLNS